MLNSQYETIINYCSKEYGIEFNDIQKKLLITLYEHVINDNRFNTLKFESFADSVFKRKHYELKYPGLDIFTTAYAIHSQN